MASIAALLLTVLAIGYAGLAPLEFQPPNGAGWNDAGSGLRFADEGLVYSEAPFAWSAGGRQFAIDVWFEPARGPRARVARLLAVQDDHEVPVLSIDEWRGALIVRDRLETRSGKLVYREYALAEALGPGRRTHLTVVSDASGLRAYLDGEPTALETPTPGLAEDEELAGTLLLGNAARGNQEWTGVVHGVAIGAEAPTPEAIAARTQASAESGARSLQREPGLVALYPFDEGAGPRAADLARHAPPLAVPAGFQPLRRTVLRWPETRDRSSAWYLRDLLTNLAGFVPAGFFATRVLAQRRPRRPLALLLGATLLALGLSLAIELTQVWLPKRVSSLSDLLSNVAGGALGSALALALAHRRTRAWKPPRRRRPA